MKADNQYKKGLWTEKEDRILLEYVTVYGRGRWNRIPKVTGLKRSGKSCRLRWLNYLNPDVKRGDFSEEEEDLIIRLHNLLGNRWSLIAGRVPGRTDNQVKNHWNSHLCKKVGLKKQVREAVSSSKTHPTESDEIRSPPDNPEHLQESKLVVNGDQTSSGDAQLFPCPGTDSPFFYNNHFNLSSPDFADFLGECPLDIIWHHL